jgi:gliding motility-associated-like protein
VVPSWHVESESCLGSDNGSIHLESVNGESPWVELSFDDGAFTKKFDYAGLSPGAYPVAWRDTLGCIYFDTLVVGQGAENLEAADSVRMCPGDSLWYNNGWIMNGGEYQTDTLSSFGCDSTHRLTVAIFPITLVDINTTDACPNADNGSALLDTTGMVRTISDITWSDGVTTEVLRTDLGPGNYSVEWRDENGCPGQQTFTIGQHIASTPDIALEDVVCAGDSTGVLYWSNQDVDSVILIGSDGRRIIDAGGEVGGLPAGSYRIVWYDRWGCTGEDSLNIEAYPETDLILPDTLRGVRGQRIVLDLEVISSWAYRVSWTPADNLSCTDCQRPELEVTSDAVYTVVVEDAQGCVTERSVVVIALEPSGNYFVPNAFTPNEDGLNDLFAVEGAYGLQLELVVYDRWGTAVFDCRGDAQRCAWDGRAGGRYVPPGVYVYRLVVYTPQGPEVTIGDVTLFR